VGVEVAVAVAVGVDLGGCGHSGSLKA
jgi:hypothetical protein